MSPPAPGDLPDAVLLVRAREGDPRSFETLVRRHERAAFATALRLVRRRADAEDAAQEAFVTAWRRLPEFRGESEFGTWLHRIVTTRALNQLRSRARHDDRRDGPDLSDHAQGAVTVGSAPVTSDPDPSTRAQTRALTSALYAALAELPEAQRTCWVLREVEGFSYGEVAEITGSSVTAVRGRLHRARTAVADAMAEWR